MHKVKDKQYVAWVRMRMGRNFWKPVYKSLSAQDCWDRMNSCYGDEYNGRPVSKVVLPEGIPPVHPKK